MKAMGQQEQKAAFKKGMTLNNIDNDDDKDFDDDPIEAFLTKVPPDFYVAEVHGVIFQINLMDIYSSPIQSSTFQKSTSTHLIPMLSAPVPVKCLSPL